MRRLAIALVALAGCWNATEIVVTVDTTFGVPCTIDSLRVEVTSDTGSTSVELAVTDADLPGSLTLVPDGHRGAVTVTVTGLRAGEPFAVAEEQTSFDRNASGELRFVLDRSCVPGPCPAVGIGGYYDLPDALPRRGCGAIGYQANETLFAMRDACLMQQQSIMGRVLANADEEEVTLVDPLPFPFSFYGLRRTRLWAGSNGYLAFSDAEPSALTMDVGAARSLGGTSFPAPGILPFWDDLRMSASGVCFAVTGEAPDRILWVTWREGCFAALGSPCGSAAQGTLTFSVALEETSDSVYIGYQTMVSTSDRAQGITATIGVTDAGDRGCSAAECASDGTCPSGAPCGYTQISAQQRITLRTWELAPR